MAIKPTSYRADYYYQKPGGSRARTSISGPVGGHLQGASTESAVVAYLKKKHPGYEIVLVKLDWK